ncbi:MAG: hypothetical protein ACFFB3_12205 [Candidatus Hodarchaeota archaeon]
MRKFGPIVFKEDYENEEEDLSSFGPTKAMGNLTARSIKTMGPLTVSGNLTADTIRTNGPLIVDEDLVAEEIKVNGPAEIGGSVQVVIGHFNGPFTVDHSVNADDSLKVNGPFEAKTLEGGFLAINGPVYVEGTIVAIDEIIIGISSRSRGDPIQAKLLKAPFVEIRARRKFLGRIMRRFASGQSEKHKRLLIETDVPIEADEVVLDGVRHTGKILAKNIILENGAEYIGNSE